MDYLQIDPRMDEHPDVEEAGFAATAVFQAVLRAVARNDGQGVLRQKYANPSWLVRRMNLTHQDINDDPEAWVGSALGRCIQVGLLEKCDEGLRVPGWEKFYKPRKPGNVRSAEWRRRQSGESATVTPVTPRDARDETRHSVTPRDAETSRPSHASPRDDTQHNSTPHHTTQQKREAAPASAKEAADVWAHYAERFGKGDKPPTEEQKTLIAQRLLHNGYTSEQLKQAIDGLAKSKHHRDKGYTALKYVLRDADTVDRNIHWASHPPDAEAEPPRDKLRADPNQGLTRNPLGTCPDCGTQDDLANFGGQMLCYPCGSARRAAHA